MGHPFRDLLERVFLLTVEWYYSGIIRGSIVGMSGSYAEIGTENIDMVVPYEIVLGMVRGDWSCLVPKRFDCIFDVFVAKGGKENLVKVFIDRAEIKDGSYHFGLSVLKPTVPMVLRETIEKLTKEWLEVYKDDIEKLSKLGRPLPQQENKSEKLE